MNCDNHSRLVVDDDDNSKFRPEKVNDIAIRKKLMGHRWPQQIQKAAELKYPKIRKKTGQVGDRNKAMFTQSYTNTNTKKKGKNLYLVISV